MFEISDKMEQRLSEMTFLDYLKYMNDRISSIRHISKSNNAYQECRTLSSHIISRYIKEYDLDWENYFLQSAGQHLRLSSQILDLYSYGNSDKKKESRISEFVKEFSYDLGNMIRARERHKENPSSPIEDEPI